MVVRRSPGRSKVDEHINGGDGATTVGQGVVAFMTRELEHRLAVVHRQRHRKRPAPRPRRPVIDGDCPLDPAGRGRREALDEIQRGRVRVSVRAPVLEIGGFDDEGVALPATSSVTDFQADALANVQPAVERDQARVVNQLVADGDEPGPFDNLVRLPRMCGSIDPGSPRVMHRSHKPKSSGPLNGPSPKLLPLPCLALTKPWIPSSTDGSGGPMRRRASDVIGGILPSGGIDEEPRAAGLRHLEGVTQLVRPDAGRAVEDLPLPLLEDPLPARRPSHRRCAGQRIRPAVPAACSARTCSCSCPAGRDRPGRARWHIRRPGGRFRPRFLTSAPHRRGRHGGDRTGKRA